MMMIMMAMMKMTMTMMMILKRSCYNYSTPLNCQRPPLPLSSWHKYFFHAFPFFFRLLILSIAYSLFVILRRYLSPPHILSSLEAATLFCLPLQLYTFFSYLQFYWLLFLSFSFFIPLFSYSCRRSPPNRFHKSRSKQSISYSLFLCQTQTKRKGNSYFV